ncbi:MAG: site-specific integrase [Clostridia bacterium]|nr:site-specific integrase [Clostridia bacterium]
MARKATRNAQGGGTIRQRSDGRWEARYTVGIDPGTEKQIQKSVYAKTQKEVRQKLSQIVTEIDDGTFVVPCNMTLSEWLDIWLKEYIGNVKPATDKSYNDLVRLNIKPALGMTSLSKLTPHMIQQMYNNLQREKGLSPKSVKNVHGVLHRAMEQAVRLGYLRVNPLNAVTLPRITKKEIKPLDDEELAAFLKEIQGNTYEYVFFVTVFTGMRQGEVMGLTWDCVDFERRTLLVNKQHNKVKGCSEYNFGGLKNDKPRLLEVAEAVMNVLQRQKNLQSKWAEQLGDAWDNRDNLVFTTEQGRYLCNQTVYLAFKKVVKKLGLDEVRFHDLRHTYAVNSIKSGDDIKTVQENLGHHTAAFTLDTYAHVTSGMKHKSANRMEQYIHSVTKV